MARIVGFVQFRAGDGPLMQIRAGAIQIEVSAIDTIISWSDENFRGEAAMPASDFQRYVVDGHIELERWEIVTLGQATERA
jgi:glutathione S-transferase